MEDRGTTRGIKLLGLNNLKQGHHRISAIAMIMALILTTFLPTQVKATSCETSDYKHLVGSPIIQLDGLYVAPNSQNDLLIGGGYT